MRAFVATLVAAAALLGGCGPSCQEACNKIWAKSECDIQVPGVSQDSMYNDCVDHCENALDTPGELRGYDPEERQTDSTTVELETDKQAAVWMDCVVETACEDLTKGYCAPI